MKKLIFFIMVVTIFCISCTGFFPSQEFEIVPLGTGNVEMISRTNIYFVNSGNSFPVDIFSTHTRTEKINTSTVQPFQTSSDIPWLPTKATEYFSFYLTYYLPIPAAGVEIPYIPPGSYGASFAEAIVHFEKRNPVPIHNIKSMIPGNALLIDDVGIVIKNNFSTAIRLQRGNIVLNPVGSSEDLINYNNSGFYRVNPAANTSGYRIMKSGIPANLPSEIEALEAGHIYIITVNSAGNPVLDDSYPLTMSKF